MPGLKRLRPEIARQLAEFAVTDFVEWRERNQRMPEGAIHRDRSPAPTPKAKRDPWAGKPQWLAEVLEHATAREGE